MKKMIAEETASRPARDTVEGFAPRIPGFRRLVATEVAVLLDWTNRSDRRNCAARTSRELRVADGPFRISSALVEVYPESLDRLLERQAAVCPRRTMPKKYQAELQTALQRIANAESVHTALRNTFALTYGRRHPKAVEWLLQDWERTPTTPFRRSTGSMFAPRPVIESPCAAVCQRTSVAKQFKKVEKATALIWKTLRVVEHCNAMRPSPLHHCIRRRDLP